MSTVLWVKAYATQLGAASVAPDRECPMDTFCSLLPLQMLQAQRSALSPPLVMYSYVVRLLRVYNSQPSFMSSFLQSTVRKTLPKGISPWAATLSHSGETLNAEHWLDWLQPMKSTGSEGSWWSFSKEKKCKLQDENTNNIPFWLERTMLDFVQK